MAKVRERPLAKGIKQIVWIFILLCLIFGFFRFGGISFVSGKIEKFVKDNGLDKEEELEVRKGSDYEIEGE